MIKVKPFKDDVYVTYPRTMEEAFGYKETPVNTISADIAMFALAGVLVSVAAILLFV
jgi:hypothetical protein